VEPVNDLSKRGQQHEVAGLEGFDLDAEELLRLADRLAAISVVHGNCQINDADALDEAADVLRQIAAALEPPKVAEGRRLARELFSDDPPAKRRRTLDERKKAKPPARSGPIPKGAALAEWLFKD
jgi:hypothetical protein